MLVLPCHQARMESFHFLSLRHILIPQYFKPLSGTSSSLAVYEIPDDRLTLKLLRTYQLPTVKSGMMVSSMIVRAEFPLQTYTELLSMSPSRPFIVHPRSTLLTVRMEVINLVQRAGSQRVMIFLQASTLLDPPYTDAELPWQLWVPSHTRIFEDFGDHFTWLCDLYGQRYVRLAPFLEPPEMSEVGGENHPNFVWVYDFNPLSVRKGRIKIKYIPSPPFLILL